MTAHGTTGSKWLPLAIVGCHRLPLNITDGYQWENSERTQYGDNLHISAIISFEGVNLASNNLNYITCSRQ